MTKELPTVSRPLRAKAGQGKLFYGMSEKQLAQIKALRADTESGLQAHAVNLYRFTELYVKRARDLAKENQKDSARDWFRFFQNSQICLILESFPNVGDLSQLRQSLKDLGTECHPSDVPSFQTDLQAIRHAVAEILSHVEQKSTTDETVSRFNPCRTVNRGHGQGQPRQQTFERGASSDAYDAPASSASHSPPPTR